MSDSQLDLFGDEPVSVLLKRCATTSREYDAIVLVVAGLHFSCDLQAGEAGDRQLRIIRRLAGRAGIDISAHGSLQERLQAAAEGGHRG